MAEVLATRAAQRLDLFAGVVHDFVAAQEGRAVRWDRARPHTRAFWRDSVGQAAASAAASQFSPRAREPLANPPDALHVMATELAIGIDGGRSRATTRPGRRRHRQVTAWRVSTIWRAAIMRGVEALQSTCGEPPRANVPALLLRLPDLRAGALQLHVDEATY